MARHSTRVYSTIAYEAITVSDSAIGFTAATMTKQCKRAECALEGTTAKGIRYRKDGTNPTATVGTLVLPVVDSDSGAYFTVEGYKDCARFKAIRDSDTDATLHVHYLGED